MTHLRISVLFALVVTAAHLASAADRPPLSEAIRHVTVRIETQKKDSGHVGTGFFYVFSNNIPALVTCRHVIQDATVGRLYFSIVSSNAPMERITPIAPLDIPDIGHAFLPHPDANVDLAILLLGPLMHRLKADGKQIDFFALSAAYIPDADALRKLGSFADVKFIGYPIGIWDAKNNLPVLRRGISATDPLVDYNGTPQFLIDAAVFPGSSGSPVFVGNEGIYSFAGTGYMGTQLLFLGVLFATPEYNKKGKVEIKTIPTAYELESTTALPTNLGLVIKADQLKAFDEMLQTLIKGKDAANKAPEATR